MVENPTDEDWTGVKMALVSGRPISFRMDLYNPLYIDRPTVEPELFASLRPVTYRGGFGKEEAGELMRQKVDGISKQIEAVNKLKKEQETIRGRTDTARSAAPESVIMGGSGKGDEKYSRDAAAELARRLDTGSVGNMATAGALGDVFQYAIDHPVTLARQKSALLPIVGKDIEGTRLSIYNEAVQTKHPLLGLRFKNTTGANLNQGPITVFEGSTYAGDTRVLNVQPNEERLLSYAIDLGTDVDPTAGAGARKITSVKAVKGIVTTVTKVTDEKTYRIVNRSQTDRTLLIEHPNRTGEGFKLVDTDKPVEDTPDVFRFQMPVKAGDTKAFTVKEERDIDRV
jgi:hypothetical protein